MPSREVCLQLTHTQAGGSQGVKQVFPLTLCLYYILLWGGDFSPTVNVFIIIGKSFSQDPPGTNAPCLSSCYHLICGCCRCPTWWCSGWRRSALTGDSSFFSRTKASPCLLVWRRQASCRAEVFFARTSCESLGSSLQAAPTWVLWRWGAWLAVSQLVCCLTGPWPEWVPLLSCLKTTAPRDKFKPAQLISAFCTARP